MKDGGTFSFDPANDDIEEYIRDVKEAAKQLGHGADAVVNLLKATMPTELYGTLYGHNNLPQSRIGLDCGPSVPAHGLWDSDELCLLPKGAVLSLALLLVWCLR